jgi:hypothetical protein
VIRAAIVVVVVVVTIRAVAVMAVAVMGSGSASTGEQQPSNPVTPTDDGSKKPDNSKDGKDGQVGVCVIGIMNPCNGQPFDHSQEPIIHRPPGFNVKQGIRNKDILFINIHNRIHSSSSSNSASTSISKTCFDVIKITWLAKIHNGQNHEVDDVIDKCLLRE